MCDVSRPSHTLDDATLTLIEPAAAGSILIHSLRERRRECQKSQQVVKSLQCRLSGNAMSSYSFLTTWVLDAPREAVYDAIHAVERWPEWWPGVVSVEKLADGTGHDGVGAVYRHRWRSVLPYTVGFDIETTRIERPALIEGRATGELVGTGRWQLIGEEDGPTTVTYEWNVETTRAWMSLLAPVGRPVFAWSHNVVMRRGGEGLARRLGVPPLRND
jgi:uncharacterized protein YndB with AHSA1/START domain